MEVRKRTIEEGFALSSTRKHEAGQHLDGPTACEINPLSDREGQQYVMQGDQDQPHHREAAILNALPGNIALLDARGLIVSVNEAWRQCNVADGMQGPRFGVGVNYLELCDKAQEDGSSKAHRAAEG